MPSQPPIPPLLSPYLALPPPTSLTLLTSTLGASATWLVLRFVVAALKKDENGKGNREGDGEGDRGDRGETRVVLVSWLRDTTFWREGGRRVGIPFQNLHVVDGLTTGLGLGVGVGFTGSDNGDSGGAGGGALEIVEREIVRAVRAVRGAVSGDGGDGVGGDRARGGAGVVGAKEEGNEKKVLLVLDGLDFLLAATGATALEMADLVSEVRSHVHSLILTASAESALMQQSQQYPTTPLEIEHSAFVTGMAHMARTVLSVRELDTGGARDVSGVLRVSRGGGWEWGFDGDFEEGEFEERECLFYVGGDGGVRVFERG